MIAAVIAIGSNSTRLLVAEKEGGRLHTKYRARRGTALLLNMRDGAITEEGLRHAAQDVTELCAEARAMGAERICLTATSATRDASNRAAFAEALKAASGLDLTLLSGDEEARLAYIAVSGGEKAAVIDVGGGSTEWTYGENGKILAERSVRIGSSRLLLEYGEIRTVAAALTVLSAARERLAAPLGAFGMGENVYGIGGTAIAAAAVFTGDHGAEGVVLEKNELDRQLRLIAPMTGDERAQIPGLPVSRASHYPHGLCILIASMDVLRAPRLTVSERTNMEGFLLSQA